MTTVEGPGYTEPEEEWTQPDMPLSFGDGLEIVDAVDTLWPNSILIFGHPKRGKSTLAGSIREVGPYENYPAFNRVLHIDCEGGSAPLARKWPDIKVVRPRNAIDVANIINTLEGPVGAAFDAVILDTVSTLQKWVQSEWLSKHPTKSGKMDFDGWAYLQDYIMDVMWQLHNMMPVGITCYHTKIEQNELTKVTWTSPYVQGGARHSVASVPDMVVYLDVNSAGARTLQVKPKSSMMTGSRYEDVLPENLTGAPTMKTIYDAIASGNPVVATKK